MGFKVTRLDLYKDVRDGSITKEEAERKWRAREVSSRAEKAGSYEGLPLGCGDDNGGATLTVGSRKSDTYLRIYDKAKEQAPDGEGRERYLQECGPWLRIEVVLKDERAQLVVGEIADRGFDPTTVGRVINAHTEFKVGYAGGKNRYRVKAWGPWRRAMQTAEKLRRAVKKAPFSIEVARYNLERQYGPTMAALLAYHEGKTEWVKEMAKRNFGRMSMRLVEALDFDGWCERDYPAEGVA
jgi:DNA relaxase NicK